MDYPVERVSWRGTPGVGDFMWALNSCHAYCYQHGVSVELEMHWEHDENYYHHFEDPETIVERMDYIHNFYHQKERVKVIHVFNSDGRYSDWRYDHDVVLEKDGTKRVAARSGNTPKNRFWFESGVYDDSIGGAVPDNNWIFRKDMVRPIEGNRIVFWRPFFNAESPRTWKRLFSNEDWDDMIAYFRSIGLQCHEITYRTPVREAMYLISTARMCICYDGMWHYVAKNFARPLAVISSEGVTKYHTGNALRCFPERDAERNVWWWIRNIRDLLGHTKQKAIQYSERMSEYYENDERNIPD